MKPVIVLLGRPNVGKSTLFNRLTRTQAALVADVPGLTRDRLYGDGEIDGHFFIVVDTGGIVDTADMVARAGAKKPPSSTVDRLVSEQAIRAIHDADAILFLVDGREGISAADYGIAELLRRTDTPAWLVVNKAEGVDAGSVTADFFQLGIGTPIPISASHGDGVAALTSDVLSKFPESAVPETAEIGDVPKIAIVGRPNVGKSTLINAMLGEQRAIVLDQPGTTRDSVSVPFQRDAKNYILIDTAGVRRRARIDAELEKVSVIKTLQTISNANVIVLVLDAQQGVTEQDTSLAGYILERGCAMVLAVNKQDAAGADDRARNKREIDRKLAFLSFARIFYVSALRGTGVRDLFPAIDDAFAAATKDLQTSDLNRVLRDAVEKVPPPMARGTRIKLKYAHQGGKNPPVIVIHGNQVDALPRHYRRYLVNAFRQAVGLEGTPLRIELRQGKNPFKGKKRSSMGRRKTGPRRVRKH